MKTNALGFTALTLLALGITAPSVQAQTVYSGADLNAGPGDPHPNSASAAASFDTAAGTLGTVHLIDFESAPLGTFTSLTAATGVTLTGSDYKGNPLYVNNTPNFPSGIPLDGFNTTPGGSQYVEQIGGTSTFTFSTPIQAFGLYLPGVQIGFYQDKLTFNDGTSQTINVPAQLPSDRFNGSLSFVGFTDAGKFITQVTITASNNFGADAIGIDDVRFVTSAPPATTPEPGTLALLAGMGISGSAFLARRRKQIHKVL